MGNPIFRSSTAPSLHGRSQVYRAVGSVDLRVDLRPHCGADDLCREDQGGVPGVPGTVPGGSDRGLEKGVLKVIAGFLGIMYHDVSRIFPNATHGAGI